jgi:hypothetical protein
VNCTGAQLRLKVCQPGLDPRLWETRRPSAQFTTVVTVPDDTKQVNWTTWNGALLKYRQSKTAAMPTSVRSLLAVPEMEVATWSWATGVTLPAGAADAAAGAAKTAALATAMMTNGLIIKDAMDSRPKSGRRMRSPRFH